MTYDLETYVQIKGVMHRVHIELDVDKLARVLGRRALDSKTGVATLLYKSIKVDVIE